VLGLNGRINDNKSFDACFRSCCISLPLCGGAIISSRCLLAPQQEPGVVKALCNLCHDVHVYIMPSERTLFFTSMTQCCVIMVVNCAYQNLTAYCCGVASSVLPLLKQHSTHNYCSVRLCVLVTLCNHYYRTSHNLSAAVVCNAAAIAQQVR
jgi:hypothetical protein